ncbi:hypothetical protein CHS0354_039409 [Potamilus streckersoni]|uniref:Uncharacterized protein n=1 Tax=Potamilus streckersoni TaxID=2493646 RepID=A0AAE0VNW5_9BIVA|nr:hypothetical protein CHS0354_039409 [Potamilus streckersoni]
MYKSLNRFFDLTLNYLHSSRPYEAISSADNLTAALGDFLQMFNSTFAEYMAKGHFQSIINFCISSASQMTTQNVGYK